MVPFIYDSLQKVYTKLLKMIVQRSIVDEVSGPRSLLAVQFNEGTLLQPQSCKFPTATMSEVTVAKPDALQKKNLMREFGLIIQAILKKIKDKCPLNYDLVRNASCLTPKNLKERKSTTISKFGRLVVMLFNKNDLTAEEADQAKDQFESFIGSEVQEFGEEFLKFDIVNNRLDTFYGKWLHRNKNYSALWKVMIFVFTLSHGQAQIERGFNINSDLLVENLSARSIVAQRLVYDHVIASSSSPHDLKIENDLRVSCMSAHSKYRKYRNEKKKDAELQDHDEKLEALLNNIETIKRQKMELCRTIVSLEKDANKCYDRAEEKSSDPEQMRVEISKGNSIRKTIGEKRKLSGHYDDEVTKLNEEYDYLKKKRKIKRK